MYHIMVHILKYIKWETKY